MRGSKIEKSKKLFEQSMKIIPGGAQNARRPNCFTKDYPLFIESGKGSHIWDIDGNEYIDWLLSFGPIILGHCNSEVDMAVKREIDKGFLFNLSSPLQQAFAEKLIEHIPCAEMVITTVSGSEATAAAIRIARMNTGKDIIIKWGYHGWMDWSLDNYKGIPKGVVDPIKTFKYNDLDSLEKVFEENKGKVAGIIMMPFEVILPEPGFLEGVRELADNNGAILIFDEIRSWPRMGLGGAQEYFGVIPDIATISKGIANGYPISAIVGKAKVMEIAKDTSISATYFVSTIGMAAALETIRQLEDGKAIRRLSEVGEKLSKGLEDILESKKVKGKVFGSPTMPFLAFGDEEINIKIFSAQTMANAATSIGGDEKTEVDKESKKAELLTDLFYSEVIKRGVFFHPKHNWFTSLAHSDDDIKKTLEISEICLDVAIRNF